MSTVPKSVHGMKAEDLYNLPDGSTCELVKGELVEMTPVGARHAVIATRIGAKLLAFVDSKQLGVVLTGDPGFILARDPDTVRAPDVAFVATGRLPPGGVPETFWPLSPDLAVEVVSPSDRPDDVQAKVLDYLKAGTRMVWVVYPRTQTITAWRSLQSIRTYTAVEQISAEDVVPGFCCGVAELFA